MVLYSNVLDIGAIYAFVIFTKMYPNWNANKTNKLIRGRLITAELLKKQDVDKRTTRPRTPMAELADQDGEIGGFVQVAHLPSSRERGRCFVCTSAKNPNVFINHCKSRGKYVSPGHWLVVCSKCGNKEENSRNFAKRTFFADFFYISHFFFAKQHEKINNFGIFLAIFHKYWINKELLALKYVFFISISSWAC